MSTAVLADGTAADLPALMAVMNAAFDPRFGEGWSANQCLGLLAMPGTVLILARIERPVGFALARMIAGECELMMLGVIPDARLRGIGRDLLDHVIAKAKASGAGSIFLEVRSQNPAIELYTRSGFEKVGSRPRYYRGNSGEVFDAETHRRLLT